MLCRNSSCTAGSLPATGDESALSGDFYAACSLDATSTGVAVSVVISGGGDYEDGDVYELKITDTSGSILFDMSAQATYRTEMVCETTCQVLELTIPS